MLEVSGARRNASCQAQVNLARLFSHYGGPYAFAETGAALSAFYQTEDNDITSVGGIVRALDSIKLTNPIEQRAFLVRLRKNRFERRETWERQNPPSRSQCSRQRRQHQPGDSSQGEKPGGHSGLKRHDGVCISVIEA